MRLADWFKQLGCAFISVSLLVFLKFTLLHETYTQSSKKQNHPNQFVDVGRKFALKHLPRLGVEFLHQMR